ncbi:MAG: glycosyltransferase, partial [Bacteroidota bacterium]
MKILQVIDSLSLGGSERMAVTMANAFAREGHNSMLVATRSEGVLKSQLSEDVRYWFLNKSNALDFSALIRLIRIIYHVKPDLVHAHSTSVFWCMLVKCFLPKTKVIWHHHLGLSNLVKAKPRPLIIFLSRWFYGAVVVNERLYNWAITELKCVRSRITYLENFSDMQIVDRDQHEFISNGLRILHLANFRGQKDHLNLLQALALLKERDVPFKAYLVGSHIDQDIANKVLRFIKERDVETQINVMGPTDDIGKYAMLCNVGVLS